MSEAVSDVVVVDLDEGCCDEEVRAAIQRVYTRRTELMLTPAARARISRYWAERGMAAEARIAARDDTMILGPGSGGGDDLVAGTVSVPVPRLASPRPREATAAEMLASMTDDWPPTTDDLAMLAQLRLARLGSRGTA